MINRRFLLQRAWSLLGGLLIASLMGGAVLPQASFAWSRTGHMMIAAMAYRELPPDLQQKYASLLQYHPEFGTWQAAYEALSVEIAFGEYLFMEASIWPDQIRRSGSGFDHPTWHYTNYPVIPGGFPLKETLTPEDDILFGLAQSKRILADASADNIERAAHLSWVLHLVGDMHQPLHTVALVNSVYPNGDRGGNDIYVRVTANRKAINLHAFWDGLLGTSHDVRKARNEATRLHQTIEVEPVERNAKARDWVVEMRVLAIDHVYLKGALSGATKDTQEQAPVLPEGYTSTAKAIAERQAVLAAKRMAYILAN